MKRSTTSFQETLFQIFFLFIFPMILLYFGTIPIEQRFLVGFPVTLGIVYIIWKEHWSLQKLGIRTDNIKNSIFPYAVFTLISVTALVVFASLLGKHQLSDWYRYAHFQYIFIFLSIAQEFYYRGFLMPKLQSVISSSLGIIVINAILFTVLHIIFPQPIITLPLIFIGGIGYATMYRFFPNLYLISLSHIILNFTATLYCFFSFVSGC